MTFYNSLSGRPSICGGGRPKGNQFVSHSVRNSGRGGRTKGGSNPLPPENHVQGNDPLGEEGSSVATSVREYERPNPGPVAPVGSVVDDTPENPGPDDVRRDRFKREFVCGRHPMTRTLFDNPLDYDGGILRSYDQGGKPFCGLAAIDVATKTRVDVMDYIHRAWDDPVPAFTVGSSDYLGDYAAFRGVNLSIVRPNGDRLVSYDHSHGFKWVVLIFHGNIAHVGHYTIGTTTCSSPADVLPPVMPVSEYGWKDCLLRVGLTAGLTVSLGLTAWYGGKRLRTVCASLSPFVIMPLFSYETSVTRQRSIALPTDRDDRGIVDQRDDLVSQDSLSEVRESLDFYCLRGIFTGPFLRWTQSKDYCISDLRLSSVLNEMAALHISGRDVNLALPTLSRLREVNTPSSEWPIILNTARVAKRMARQFKDSHTFIHNKGAVAVNVPGNTSYLPPVAINNVANQVRGQGQCPNKIVHWVRSEAKEGVPVGVAPIGAPVPIGSFAVTDGPSAKCAFIGRSMSVDPKLRCPVLLKEFKKFSAPFLIKMVDAVNLTFKELPIPEAYRIVASKTKSQDVIESNLKRYEDYLDGRMSPQDLKEFCRASSFVKFENNTKVVAGSAYVRPRNIVVMSDKDYLELANVSLIMDEWAHGPISKFQIKGMDSMEVCQFLQTITDQPHCVTDMSSFECSIDSEIRELENLVISRLLRRAGAFSTLRKFKILMSKPRRLYTKWGVTEIDTRCSGDYWTSTGNGIVNICLAAFAAYKRGVSVPSIIAEGDDGVVPLYQADESLYNRLGFKFSSEVRGTRPGDCDFLRSRWINGYRLLSVGRSLSMFWVKGGAHLRKSKQMFLLRCIGNSLHHLSPGHPVLWAIVKVIGEATAGVSDFAGSHHYLDKWKGHHILKDSNYPRDPQVVEELRVEVATGAIGFPPISINEQLCLEERILKDHGSFYLGRLLDGYDDVSNNKLSDPETGRLNTQTSHYDQINDLLGLDRAGRRYFLRKGRRRR